jgi:hypothetical protein
MLLLLMVAVAMLTITMMAVARNYKRGIQRDREVEMIHRGEQYARAVKKYYLKFGSYPLSIEQLEKTNNIRFLRKKYKDPMSPDGEWKVAHLTDITLKTVGGLTPTGGTASGSITGTSTAGGGTSTTTGGTSTAGAQSIFGSSSSNATGAGQNTDSSTAGTNTGTNTSNSTQGSGATGTGGSSSTNGNPVLGGGPVVGVVSKMKTEGIHSFGDKSKYSEWFFIYDPSQDKGQLLVGPYNPNVFIGAANSGLGNSNKGTGNTQTQTPSSGAPSTTPPTTNQPTTNQPTTTP